MRKFKMILALLLSVVLLSTATAYAVETEAPSDVTPHIYRNEDYYYQVNPDSTVTLLLYTGEEKSVKIPDTLEGLPVIEIGEVAFMGTDITSLALGKNIEKIGNEAFASCQELSYVSLTGTIGDVTFGNGIFRNCQHLHTVFFGEQLTTLGDYMFYGCKSLSYVLEISNLRTIPQGAFAYCTSLTGLGGLDKTHLNRIEKGAFYRSGLVGIYLPYTVNYFGDLSFAYIPEDLRIVLVDSYGVPTDSFYKTPYISSSAFEGTAYEFDSPEMSPTPPGDTPTTTTEPAEPPTLPTEPTYTEPVTVCPTLPISPTLPTEPTEPTTKPTSTCPSEPQTTPPAPINPSYTPGSDFIFDSFSSFESNEAEVSSKGSSYKSDLEKTLVATAWDVRMVGDANYDGLVNIKDSTLVQKFAAKLIGKNDFNYKNADVNTDGQVTVKDGTLIQKRAANIIQSFF